MPRTPKNETLAVIGTGIRGMSDKIVREIPKETAFQPLGQGGCPMSAK